MLQGCFGNVTRGSAAVWLLVFLLCGIHAVAQTSSQKGAVSETSKADEPDKKKAPGEKIKRWLEVDQLSIATRYRFIESNSHLTSANQDQYQFIARGRFKFDAKGKYSVYAGVYSGNTLTGGWNNSGWGTGRDQTNLYLKQLYFNAKPVKGLEIQFGGLGGYNGENTEITGLDNDVYLTGERVQVRRPKELFFDEVAFTNAFLGDTTTPNVFRRFKHLNEANYRQLMVRKQLGNRGSFSADYTYEAGRDTLHQAMNIKTPELKILDRVVFENYQRIDPNAGYGFALQGEKKLFNRLTLNGGFARIDKPMFNADRFPPGDRLFVVGNLKISREFTFNAAVIHAVGDLPTAATPRTRVDLIISYNLLETFHRLKIF
jgi:hypothetical protein